MDLVRLLRDHDVSGLPVIDEDDKATGVVSETELMQRQARSSESGGRLDDLACKLRRRACASSARNRARTAGGIMSAPAVTVRAQAGLPEAARLMTRHGIERLPVVDEEDRLVGIVTHRDLLQVFLRADDEIRRAVQREVLVDARSVRPWERPQSIRTRAWSLSARNLLPVTVPTPPRKVSSAGRDPTAGWAAES
ncbi:CBS domain-containing protein [Streptomyces sp. NPDC006739]|uniref:CBS domain-containing protein n=1 Tax=Streptomyces sp. NPDC006739 TaxID=3364763 RepID=UPI0036828579